jgi:hypothetical protein
MKKILFVFFIILLIRQVNAQSPNEYLDSIILYIHPDSVKQNDSSLYVFYTIENRSTLALVTIEDVVVDGFNIGNNVWPSPFQNSSNFLALLKKDFGSVFGDGHVRILYNHLPRFLVIGPKETKVININFSVYENIIRTNNWLVGGTVFLAVKDSVDALFKNEYSGDLQNYLNSLDTSDTVVVNAKTWKEHKEDNKLESSKLGYKRFNDLFIFSTIPPRKKDD